MSTNNEKIRIVIASPHLRHDSLEESLSNKLEMEVLRVRDQESLVARWRGASVGCEAAEAFMLGRCII